LHGEIQAVEPVDPVTTNQKISAKAVHFVMAINTLMWTLRLHLQMGYGEH